MAVRGFACILLLLISGLVAGCAAPGNGWQTVAFAAQPNAYGLPLETVWNATVAASGVDNRTAVLDQCWINLDEGGSLDSILLEFFGVAEGTERFCSARYHTEQAKISVRQSNTTINAASASGPHPLAVLTAIEDLPFREITFGEEGLVVIVESQSGNLGYTAEYSDIFLLENGTLEPLGDVAFSTDRPWYTILVSRRTAPDLVTTEGDTRVVVYRASTVPESPGQRSSFTVFTPEELAKAETVVRMEER